MEEGHQGKNIRIEPLAGRHNSAISTRRRKKEEAAYFHGFLHKMKPLAPLGLGAYTAQADTARMVEPLAKLA
jgi:hypothetical protein